MLSDYARLALKNSSFLLFSAESRSLIFDLCDHLNFFPFIGFESRLDTNSRSDFLIYIPKYYKGSPYIQNNNYKWDNSWKELCEKINNPNNSLSKIVHNTSLEFDLTQKSDISNDPCIFFSIKPNINHDKKNWDILAKNWPVNIILSKSIFLKKNLCHCLDCLPQSAYLAHVGVMSSRSEQSIRIVIKDLKIEDSLTFLKKIGIETTNQIRECLKSLSNYMDRVAINLDIGETISQKIGVECKIIPNKKKGINWEFFLDFLVSKNLCLASKKEALLEWENIFLKYDHRDLWPNKLNLGDIIAGNDSLSYCYRKIYHIKIICNGKAPFKAKVYFEFGHKWIKRSQLVHNENKFKSLKIPDKRISTSQKKLPQDILENIKEYYDSMNSIILQDVGSTYQSGLLKVKVPEENPYHLTNLYCASQAEIKAGDYILDAGCGTCGPSIDIAKSYNDLHIEAITLSSAQAKSAKLLVQDSSLEDTIHIHTGDFHELSFRDNYFDCVIFLESSGYSYDLFKLYREVLRVLKPGGKLYIKGPYIKESELTLEEEKELQTFNFTYKYKTNKLSAEAKILLNLGFKKVQSKDISHLISTQKAYESMIIKTENKIVLTEFGKNHYRSTKFLPITFGEIKAYKALL